MRSLGARPINGGTNVFRGVSSQRVAKQQRDHLRCAFNACQNIPRLTLWILPTTFIGMRVTTCHSHIAFYLSPVATPCWRGGEAVYSGEQNTRGERGEKPSEDRHSIPLLACL